MEEQKKLVRGLIPVLKEKIKTSSGKEKIALEKAIRAFDLILDDSKTVESGQELQQILAELQELKET